MIKIETIGMLDVAKVNPVLKSENDIDNYSFVTIDDDLYLVANTITGDNAYKEDIKIKAGDFLNGFLVSAWDGQKLVVDEKHIAYASGETYASIVAGTTLMGVDSETGKIKVIETAPSAGVYFKVTDKVLLTENAVKVKVIVVDTDTVTDTVDNG